jgi:hypothetical protein
MKLSLFNETGPEAFTEWGRLFHKLCAWQILLNMLTCRSGVLSRFTDLGSRHLLFRFGGWGVFHVDLTLFALSRGARIFPCQFDLIGLNVLCNLCPFLLSKAFRSGYPGLPFRFRDLAQAEPYAPAPAKKHKARSSDLHRHEGDNRAVRALAHRLLVGPAPNAVQRSRNTAALQAP